MLTEDCLYQIIRKNWPLSHDVVLWLLFFFFLLVLPHFEFKVFDGQQCVLFFKPINVFFFSKTLAQLPLLSVTLGLRILLAYFFFFFSIYHNVNIQLFNAQVHGIEISDSLQFCRFVYLYGQYFFFYLDDDFVAYFFHARPKIEFVDERLLFSRMFISKKREKEKEKTRKNETYLSKQSMCMPITVYSRKEKKNILH